MSSSAANRVTRSTTRRERLRSKNNGDGEAKSSNLKQQLQVSGDKLMSMNHNIIAVCSFTRRKRKGRIPFLPHEIIFNILLWVPAQIVFDVMRFVCKEWNNMIQHPDFISAHLHNSTTGLFIETYPDNMYAELMVTRNCEFEVTELRFPWIVIILASCNGLLLLKKYTMVCTSQFLYVANPVTKQLVALPPLSVWCCSSSFGYVASTREYKVVHAYRSDEGHFMCEILTVGVDKAWRLIDTKNVSSKYLNTFLFSKFSIRGFIYWLHYGIPYTLILDLETEIFHLVPLPLGSEEKVDNFSATESFLSIMTSCSGFSWDLWVLKDVKKGEWAKLRTIDLESQKCMHEPMLHPTPPYPVAWLQNGEVLIFDSPKPFTFIAHNVKKGQISSFQKYLYTPNRTAMLHVQSLVSLKL